MKLITLWEPWATLMATGAKKIETRHWSTEFRGTVAIHAAKGGLSKEELKYTCTQQYFADALKDLVPEGRRHVPAFHFGHILAVGELVDCLPTDSTGCLPGIFDDWKEFDTPQERAFGNYEPGRFGFLFGNVGRLKHPVPFSSRQGKLLDLDSATEALVLEQLK